MILTCRPLGCFSDQPIRSSSSSSSFTFKSKKTPISCSTTSTDSQPRWAFSLRGFIFRVPLSCHPFAFTPKMTKLLSGEKSQQVSSQMQFLFYLSRRMKFARESGSIRSYQLNFQEMSKTRLRFLFPGNAVRGKRIWSLCTWQVFSSSDLFFSLVRQTSVHDHHVHVEFDWSFIFLRVRWRVLLDL